MICLLTLFGLAVAEVILLVFGDQAEKVHYGNEYLAFAPVYNRSGTWFHGRLHIGYNRGLQLAENIITLWIMWFLYRFMAWMNLVCGVNNGWLCGLDFGTAGTFARLITNLRGHLILDYIYISWLHGTYDVIDFYLGITMTSMILWFVVCEVRYLRIKKRKTAGMSFWQKTKWAFVLTGNSIKAVFTPKKNWKGLIEKYGYWDE